MLMPLEGDSGSIGHREELDNVITGYSWLLVVFRNTLKNVSGAVAQVVLAATMNIAYVLRVWDDLEELVQDRNISQYTEKGHHGIAYVLQLRRLQYSICPADHDVHDMIHTRKVLMDSIGDVMERQHLEQDLLVGFEKRSSIDLAETQLFIPGVLLQIPAVAKAINQDGRRDCLWRPVGHILHDNKVNEKLQSRYHEDGHDVLGRSRLHIASTLDADKQRDLELLSLPRSAWPDMESLGLNALHVAAIHGNTHMFRHAAASGYDVAHSPGRHLSSHTMRTYLHWAACFGHLELVEYLLDRYGARHDLMYTLVYLDRFGDTALHLAASNGHAEVVEAILRHTDWSRMKSACFDHTPFWEATIGGHLDIMKLLVSVSNVDEKETIGRTPLAEAARLGFLEGVEYLLQLDGVAMDSINRCWDETAKKILFKTPLDLAFEGGHNECAALLVRHGASTWQQLRA
jgi:ankyrin repeat protein